MKARQRCASHATGAPLLALLPASVTYIPTVISWVRRLNTGLIPRVLQSTFGRQVVNISEGQQKKQVGTIIITLLLIYVTQYLELTFTALLSESVNMALKLSVIFLISLSIISNVSASHSLEKRQTTVSK